MDQANDGSMPPRTINQPARAVDLFDEETLLHLQGISGMLDFVAHGCKHLGGPPLWSAIAYLAQALADTVDAVEAKAEQAGRLARREQRR